MPFWALVFAKSFSTYSIHLTQCIECRLRWACTACLYGMHCVWVGGWDSLVGLFPASGVGSREKFCMEQLLGCDDSLCLYIPGVTCIQFA